MQIGVGVGRGVFVACGVLVGGGVFVGCGVLVGGGVLVGCGVLVGGTGVLVGSGVFVGRGVGVNVGGGVNVGVGLSGVADGDGAGVDVAEPAGFVAAGVDRLLPDAAVGLACPGRAAARGVDVASAVPIAVTVPALFVGVAVGSGSLVGFNCGFEERLASSSAAARITSGLSGSRRLASASAE
jgi:hypothetical protein